MLESAVIGVGMFVVLGKALLVIATIVVVIYFVGKSFKKK
jgi:hypothetical protein